MSNYDCDVVLWSERQSELLRRIATGESVSSAELDWSNIAEEIARLGWAQIDAVESLLFQALVHMLKADAWPLSPLAPWWRHKACILRAQARRRFTPSMCSRIDVAGLYRDAFQAMPEAFDGQPPRPLPHRCPVTLDGLLREE